MRPMNQNAHPIPENENLDAEIDALLVRDDTASIVDSLLSLPDEHSSAAVSGEWGRVLAGRLQTRLAERMRRALGTEKESKSAA